MADCIVFWQRMLTPHMTELAKQLGHAGAEVYYVAEQRLSADRLSLGWEADDPTECEVHYIVSSDDARELVDRFPRHAVHITQGVRANGLIAHAQRRIALEGLRQYAIMETVDLRGPRGWIKQFLYAFRFCMFAGSLEGLLAIGEGTAEWVMKRSPRTMRAIPFAYFLRGRNARPLARVESVFKFLFVGSLIGLKRVDLLLEALSGLLDRPFEVEIIGDGSDRMKLERQAKTMLPGRTIFLGTVGMNAAINRIALADCLVLPSAHDGWGAVVSEAQINGTPVVCSTKCGAAGTVRASGFGAVFDAGDVGSLRRCLAARLDEGWVDEARRERLSAWARCLTADVGAQYLLDIIHRDHEAAGRIVPPWERVRA